MGKRRRVEVTPHHKVDINYHAFRKLVFYYYKGPNNVEVRFDNRIAGWGNHMYEPDTNTHTITISPFWNSTEQSSWSNTNKEEMYRSQYLSELNEYDMSCRIIHTFLHEIKHAMQCDISPTRYAEISADKHPLITNDYLSYIYSDLESQAEGWALINFNRALEKYDMWCHAYDK